MVFKKQEESMHLKAMVAGITQTRYNISEGGESYE